MEQHKKKTYVKPVTEVILIGEELLQAGVGNNSGVHVIGAKEHNGSWNEEGSYNPWDDTPSSPRPVGSTGHSFGNKSSLWDD